MFRPPREAKQFREEHSQEIVGIGVRLGFSGDPLRLTVVGPPIPGRPAEQAGIRQSDAILAVDGTSTEGFTVENMSNAVELIRGKPGEPVDITVLHVGEEKPVTLSIVRVKMMVDSVRGDYLRPDQSWEFLLKDNPNIALVRITRFGLKTTSELEKLLPRLVEAGAQAIVLDLRDNPGGSLPSAIETCEFFLPEGKAIVETRYRIGKHSSTDFSRSTGRFVGLPLVVLVNRYSASASEIVAACLQDHGRAIVVGERSYGKGTVQEVLSMEAGKSLLKLTRASFWRPSGKNIHRTELDRELANGDWGVKPNPGFEVNLDDEAYIAWLRGRANRDSLPLGTEPAEGKDPPPPYTDPVLQRAVEALQKQLDQK